MSGQPPLVVYVDVDDTLVRSFGSKRIPMSAVVDRVRLLHRQGATLYCWSSGGEDYARRSAAELGLSGCFIGYLPKPHVMVDDQPPADWSGTIVMHPNEVTSTEVADLRKLLARRSGAG